MTKKFRDSLKRNTKKHKAYLRNTSSVFSKTAYSNTCKTVQTTLRDIQDSWLRKKADEIQSFADRKDMKKFFDALKTVYGPQSSGTTPLFSADGTILLTDKETILKRWAEHFYGVLNRPSYINDEAVNRLPQVECNLLLDELPTVSETVKAINLLSSGKAPGSDAIPAEIYKAGGPPVTEKLTVISHYVEKRSHPSRIQGRNNYPPIQRAPGKPYKEPTITVKGQRLQVVDKFTYLGNTLSRVEHFDDEVNARIAKASAAFGRLRESIWDRR